MQQDIVEPKLQSIYDWVPVQDDSKYEITAILPEGITPENISVKLNKETGNIIATIKEKLPFLSGKVFGPISDISYHYADKTIHFIFKKATKDNWPLPFKGPVNKKTPLDPQSCLLTFMINASQGIDSTDLLLHSVSAMFPPAVLSFANLCQQTGQNLTDSIVYLKAMVKDYHVPQAATLLGHFGLFEMGLSQQEGIDYLKYAADHGEEFAKITLGYVYSPYEEPHGPWENVDLSVEYFNQVKDNPRSQYGLGLIEYNKGNKELGRSMVRNARIDLPNMPDLAEIEGKMPVKRNEELNPVENQAERSKSDKSSNQESDQGEPQTEQKGVSTGIKASAAVMAGLAIAGFAALAFSYMKRRK